MNDLISRQDVIDTLAISKEFLLRVLDDTDIVGQDREKYSWGLGLIESFINDVGELPSAEPHWIPCNKKTPDESDYDEDFQVTVRAVLDDKKYSECDVDMGTWTPDGWDVLNFWWNDYEVIAWMPLPEPYNPEEESGE